MLEIKGMEFHACPGLFGLSALQGLQSAHAILGRMIEGRAKGECRDQSPNVQWQPPAGGAKLAA